MYKSKKEAISYIDDFRLFVKDVKETEIVLAVPFTLLDVVSGQCKGTNIKVGAQNLFYEKQGAFTGEISPAMVKEFADYVIVGHSERRRYFSETNEAISKKITAALKHSLRPVFCLGETLEQRNNGQTNSVIETQLREALTGLNQDHIKNIIIAYEPVWAIGTGNTATPEQAEEIHIFIRGLIKDLYNEEISKNLPIIYGGSVNENNAAEILAKENIDGCLPGGASLDPGKLSKIIKS